MPKKIKSKKAVKKKPVAKKKVAKKKVVKKVAKKSVKKKVTKKKPAIKQKKKFTKKKPVKPPVVLTDPEDKYTEALLNQELLAQEKRAAIKPEDLLLEQATKKQATKTGTKFQLFVLVAVTFIIIFLFWVSSLKLDLKIHPEDISGEGSLQELMTKFTDFKASFFNFEENVIELEKSNENKTEKIYNPNNLTEEEIQAMEEKVFPKLK